jgi:hypothetical protein
MPLKSLCEAGVPVSLATDNTPITLWQPMQQTVLRQAFGSGRAFGEGQALSPMAALRCATLNGAYLTFDEAKKGSLEVLEIRGAAGQLKTDLFGPAIHEHHGTFILLAIEDVGNDHEKCFFASNFDWIHLLGNDCDIGTAARNAVQCFFSQLLWTLLIEYRRLAKDDLCDRPCGLSSLLRI